jgi:hypothetical protein
MAVATCVSYDWSGENLTCRRYPYAADHDRHADGIRPLLHRQTRPHRQRERFIELGVAADRIYLDHGFAGTNHHADLDLVDGQAG